MPNLVKCPKCGGAVLVESVDDPSSIASCPLCAADFMIGELTDVGIPLAVASSAAPSNSASDASSDQEPSFDIGDSPASSDSSETNGEAMNFDTDVVEGQAWLSDAPQWTYPGCETWTSARFESASAKRLQRDSGLVSGVARTSATPSWTYPGITDWVADPLVVEQAASEPSWSDTAPLSVAPASPRFGGPDFGNVGDLTGASAPAGGSPIRVGKRRKSKELNPMFLMAGVIGGGSIGLMIGYMILVLIDPTADFLGLWQ